MKEEIKNYGFQAPVITSDNHVLGGLGTPKKILNPYRDWTEYTPPGEHQKKLIETSNCTQFATISAAQTLERMLHGKTKDYSERAVAIGSGNTITGNSPHRVAEWIRKNGLPTEDVLPFNETIASWEEYMTPNPLTNSIIRQAKKFPHTLNHEWVFFGGTPEQKREKLWEALQYSPLGVSVVAWQRDGKYYVKSFGQADTHWTLLVAGEYEKHWLIFDSYMDDNWYKELRWDYDFGFSKLYILNSKITCWQRLLRKLPFMV